MRSTTTYMNKDQDRTSCAQWLSS